MKPQKYKAKSKLFTKTKRRKAVAESANVPVAESIGKPRSGPTCVNCDQKFRERSDGRGFFRFSLEKTFPCGKVAMELLTNITGVPFSTRTKIRRSIDGHFLCPACWQLANKIGWYMDSFSEFRARSSPSSYIGRRNASFRHQLLHLLLQLRKKLKIIVTLQLMLKIMTWMIWLQCLQRRWSKQTQTRNCQQSISLRLVS